MTAQLVIKFLADGAIIPIVLLAGYALLFKVPKGSRYEVYARVIMAGLTAYLVAKLLGSIWQPSGERPFQILGVAAGASYLPNPGFPSDHALFTAFLTFAVWFETRQKAISIIMAILTVAVCVGRVLALVHTPLDVTAGVVVAATGIVWYLQADRASGKTDSRKKDKNLVQ